MPGSVLGEGLVFDDTMPVGWFPGPPPDGLALARLNADNHQLLIAESTLDDVRPHEALKEESPAVLHELQRLDYKLNILLRLTAQLALRQNGLPAPTPVRFTASGLEWTGADVPALGATGLLMLYVNPSLPEPLRIPADVIDVSHIEAPVARLQFTGLSESVVDLIEKLIFRHHRRLVAGSKLATPIIPKGKA
jgi:hypothetical protein